MLNVEKSYFEIKQILIFSFALSESQDLNVLGTGGMAHFLLNLMTEVWALGHLHDVKNWLLKVTPWATYTPWQVPFTHKNK